MVSGGRGVTTSTDHDFVPTSPDQQDDEQDHHNEDDASSDVHMHNESPPWLRLDLERAANRSTPMAPLTTARWTLRV
jgi:hypothetical protein